MPKRLTGTPLLAVGLAILLLAPLLLATTAALGPRLLTVLILAWALPGALLLARWRLPSVDMGTAALLATGLGLCWLMLVALLVHWWPGPVRLWPLVWAYEAGAVVLLLGLAWRRPVPIAPAAPSLRRGMALLLVVASALFLLGLSGREFYHDETFVLIRAREAIRGEDDALARHTKGPGEIAITLAVYRVLGTTNEATARLPFALAGVAAVLATALVGRRLFSPAVGFWAGVLLSINGFVLGLSRIAQYQPALLLLAALAFLAAWEFAHSGEAGWLLLAVVFSAFGLLLHYEFGLMGPVLLVLAAIGWRRTQKREALWTTLIPGGVALALPAIAYLALYSHPYFREATQEYYATRFGSPETRSNIRFFLEIGTVYNSIYFLVGLGVLVAAGMAIGWRRERGPTLALVLWFLPYFAVYLFVIRFPGTHFYALMESWSVLAALPLSEAVPSRSWGPAKRRMSAVLLSGWLALSGGYLYLAFFRQSPEYLINFERTRNRLYWVPYSTGVARKPRLGLPIQEGWKALGVLSEWRYLEGTYASNEHAHHLRWYLGAFDRVDFDAQPDFIFVAAHVLEPEPTYHAGRLRDYRQVGEIRVRGEPRIALFTCRPLDVPYLIYDAEAFTAVFDMVVPSLEDGPQPATQPVEAVLGGVVTLEKVAPAHRVIARGETLHLILWWRPERPLSTDYKLFVHLGAGRPLAQWDGFPDLNTGHTSRWTPGRSAQCHVLLPVPRDLAPGRYPLSVGLYDETSGERLGGEAVPLGTVTVY